MTTNTDINTLSQQLRVSALKASRGVWRGAMTRFNGITNNEVTAVLFNREPEAIIASAVEKRDAEFIALANPINTLIILDALEAAQKRIAELEASQPVVPEGWKLVPIEPTPDMIAAGDECWMMTESCADWVSDMDYSKLSDFEINTLVAKLTGNYGSCEPVFNVVFRSSGTEFNPINRPEQAWPIIERNKISLVYVKNEWSARQYHNACIEICGKSAFKCAMIVFLMMSDEAH